METSEMRSRVYQVLCVFTVLSMTGCYSTVKQGHYGRVKTASGWQDDVYKDTTVTTYGRDVLYQVDATEDSREMNIEILVGGKVNLTITIDVLYGLSKDPAKTKPVFENVAADENYIISRDGLFDRYLKRIVTARPQEIIGSQPDIQTVIANLPQIVKDCKKEVIDESKTTPAEIFAFEITNYDWPDSITKAQERLAAIELKEAEQKAQVRADLEKARGQLQVEEANKLVEAKKAEGIAEGIRIVRDELKDCPEYLQWHTVRAMSEAATGPNNSFILFPYNMPGVEEQVPSMMQTALLDQVLQSDASTTKNPPKETEEMIVEEQTQGN